MTANAVITLADEIAPNAFSNAVKLLELNRIENRVRLDVLLEDPDDVEQIESTELATHDMSLPESHCDVYVQYLASMYYWRMGEYELYQNEKAMFEEAWTRLCRDVCYECHQGTGGPEYVTEQ